MPIIEPFVHRESHICILASVGDVLRQAGHDLSEPMVSELGSASLFAYVGYRGRRFVAFLGRPTDYLHHLAQRTGAGLREKRSCASFAAAWRQVRRLVDEGTPVILGPLDLRHLPFYPVDFEIPWHFNVLAGYDGDCALIYDNRLPDVQRLAAGDLDRAWSVKALGLGRGPYAYTVFQPPRTLSLRPLSGNRCGTPRACTWRRPWPSSASRP